MALRSEDLPELPKPANATLGLAEKRLLHVGDDRRCRRAERGFAPRPPPPTPGNRQRHAGEDREVVPDRFPKQSRSVVVEWMIYSI